MINLRSLVSLRYHDPVDPYYDGSELWKGNVMKNDFPLRYNLIALQTAQPTSIVGTNRLMTFMEVIAVEMEII